MKHELFWLENPIVLCKSLTLLPKPDMLLEEQMNCITRLVIFIFLVLHLIGYNQSTLFLILSNIFIIILYYLQKSKKSRMSRKTYENYSDPTPPYSRKDSNGARNAYIEKSEHLYGQGVKTHVTNRYTFDKYPSYFNQQVESVANVTPDQTFRSNSQALVGDANPKTRIAPIVAPPIYEWAYWKDNDFVVPNIINEKTEQDYYGSGYYTTPSKSSKSSKLAASSYRNNSNYSSGDLILNNASVNNPILNINNKTSKMGSTSSVVEGFTYIGGDTEKKKCNSCTMPDPSMMVSQKDRTNGDFKKFNQKNGDEKKVRYSGDLIESTGYDETNLQYNLPSNYASSNCERKPELSALNSQIFTSTVVPGVYYKNQIIEPIDSNIGISFEQQIPPRKVVNENGEIVYTSMDPKLYTPVQAEVEPLDVPSTYDVYDPRSNGYGTSYRGYTDKMTGRPRFFYDDVEAIRRPNYITRTEIDHLKGVDTYGPIRSDEDTQISNDTIRETVENAFSEQTLDFRTDMMTRLMRKRNAELWQIRMAPKSGMQKNFKC
jgi:hypothetical protein